MSAKESRALISRYFHEFVNNHDISVLRELLSPRIVDHHADDYSLSVPGQRRSMLDVFPDVQDSIEVIAAEDDKVAVRVFATGTHTGELFRVPATGKQITWTATMIWRITDGKITERWIAFDTLSQMLQLGVIPPLKHVLVPRQQESMLSQQLEIKRESQITSIAEERLKPLKMFIAALRTGNLALEESVAPGYIDHGGWIDGLPGGPEGLKQEVTVLRQAFSDLEITIQDFFATDEHAVLRMTGTGKHVGEIFGVPATNKHVTWMTIGIYKVEQGKIRERWIDASRLQLLQQLGVIPPLPIEPLSKLRPDAVKW